MARHERVDAALVRRGLARTRAEAAALVAADRVRVAGAVAGSAAARVPAGADLAVLPAPEHPFVSRGGVKLRGALEAFAPLGLSVAGARCLDAGASTGGFTDALLAAGAREVVAVDVGYGVLAWRLRQDPRVRLVERTNVRYLTAEIVGAPVDVVTADLSFISLVTVFPALLGCARPGADLLLLVKPQFEVPKGTPLPRGVVTDPVLRRDTVRRVAGELAAHGAGIRAAARSVLPGRNGNVEYFCWLRAGEAGVDPAGLLAADLTA